MKIKFPGLPSLVVASGIFWSIFWSIVLTVLCTGKEMKQAKSELFENLSLYKINIL